MSKTSTSYRILFVDDNEADIHLVSSILKSHHYHVVAESNSQLVIEKLKKEPFDLILLDIIMPELDGYNLCKKIKSTPDLLHIPIIFVTSKSDTESVVEGLKTGAVDYITKPFNKHELILRIQTHIELKKSKEELEIELRVRLETERQNLFLAAILRSTEDIAVIKDLDLRVINGNSAWAEATGKPLGELIGKTDEEIFDKEFAEGYMEDERAAQKLGAGECIIREEKIRYPNGEICTLSTRKFPVYDENDVLIATANISRNITQEKNNEQKLLELNKKLEELVKERTQELKKESENLKKTDLAFRESQVRLEHLYKNLSIGLYRVNAKGSFLMANPALVRLLRRTAAEEILVLNLFNDFFQSENEINSFVSTIEKLGELNGYGIALMKEDGDKLHVRISAKPFFDEKGKLKYYEGSIEDITQTKIAEEELKIKERQYRMLFDNMTNGFILQEMLVDQNDEIIDYYYLEMNRALQNMMGEYYKPYKFIGRTMKEVPLNIDPDWFEKCKKVAIYGEQFHFEKYLPELNKHFEMLLYQPQYGQIATIINDITARKEAEEKINEQYQKIVQQNELIEQKNRSITDSINCAQRIQISMLPKLRAIKKHLPETFIFYRPKDIVSGDFYWFNIVDEKIILAIVDCTGHGVPGGYMSMVGNDMLNLIVNVKDIISPEVILLELHKRIRESLARHDDEILDGMDAAICLIDKKNKTLEYSGAKIPLLYIQNNELHKIKGDHTSIAVLKKPTSFYYEKHTIDISEPTIIYLYSDGYQDQFGGDSRKKFLPQRFENLLFKNHNELFDEQKRILKKTIDDWTGNFDQLDDILVFGSKIS